MSASSARTTGSRPSRTPGRSAPSQPIAVPSSTIAALCPGWRISGQAPSASSSRGPALSRSKTSSSTPLRSKGSTARAGSDQWCPRAAPAINSARRRSSTGSGSLPAWKTRPISNRATSRRPCRTFVSRASRRPGCTREVRRTDCCSAMGLARRIGFCPFCEGAPTKVYSMVLGDAGAHQHVADDTFLFLPRPETPDAAAGRDGGGHLVDAVVPSHLLDQVRLPGDVAAPRGDRDPPLGLARLLQVEAEATQGSLALFG